MKAAKHKPSRRNYIIWTLFILCFISFLGINIGTALFGSSYKLDLTQNKQYTLHPSTLQWLQKNKSRIFIKLYLSDGIKEEYPQIDQYSRYLIKLLEQYQINSKGTIQFEIVSVNPYSATEEEARKQGLRPFLDKKGKSNFYFGAVLADERGQSYTIPYLNSERQNYIEQDIDRILGKLNGYEAQRIGVLSSVLPVIDTKENLNNRIDWPFVKQLRKDYEVEYIRSDKTQIPVRIKTLLVVNPSSLAPMTIYALDQYLMRGGKIILFLDPFAESFMNLFGYINTAPSNLEQFLQNFGVLYQENRLIGDNQLSQNTLINQSDRYTVSGYPLWFDVTNQQIDASHPITQGLRKLRFKSAGGLELKKLPQAQGKFLVTSSDNSGEIDASVAKYAAKSSVLGNFIKTNRHYPLAVLQEGKFMSMFEQNPIQNTEIGQMMIPFLMTSIRPGKLLVISDSDFLYTPNWSKNNPLEGDAYDTIPYNDNLSFVLRAVDYMTDNNKILFSPSLETKEDHQTFAQIIKDKIAQKSNTQEAKLKEQLLQAQQKQKQLQENIKKQSVFPSAALIKEFESYQREEENIKYKLQEFDFQINQQQKYLMNLFVVLNLILFPAMVIGIIFAYDRRQRKKQQHRAEEIVNAK